MLVEQHKKAAHGNGDAIQEQSDHGDAVVGIVPVRFGVFRQRWQHTEQDRDQREGDADPDGDRRER